MSIELIAAVNAGDIATLRNLLSAGGDVNARDEDGATLLMLAAHCGNLAMVQALLAAGADVNATDERGWAALAKSIYNAEQQCGHADVAQILIGAGANLEAAVGYGVRPLMLAAGYGEAELVALLVNSGADVLARNEGDYTALMMAKQKHYVDVINMLHEAEHYAGVGEGSCESRNPPGVNVVTFMKRPAA